MLINIIHPLSYSCASDMLIGVLILYFLTQVKDEESQTEEIVKSIQTTSGLAQKAKETYSQRCQVC